MENSLTGYMLYFDSLELHAKHMDQTINNLLRYLWHEFKSQLGGINVKDLIEQSLNAYLLFSAKV